MPRVAVARHRPVRGPGLGADVCAGLLLVLGGGAPAASSELTVRIIVRAYGLEDQLTPAPLDLEEIVAGMQRGELDAGFMVSRFPRRLIVELNHEGKGAIRFFRDRELFR